MKRSAEEMHAVTQEACRVLGMYRKALRGRSMLDEDMDRLAEILDWVEECFVTTEEIRNKIAKK